MTIGALFGAGRIGKVRTASIKSDPRAQLVAVTDVMEEAAKALAAEHGVACAAQMKSSTTPTSTRPDCLSTSTHADLIQRGVAASRPCSATD